MAGQAVEGPILLIKKLGGLLLVILGCLLIATGVNAGYTGLTVAGVAVVALGAVLLALRIVRRNRSAKNVQQSRRSRSKPMSAQPRGREGPTDVSASFPLHIIPGHGNALNLQHKFFWARSETARQPGKIIRS